VTDRPIIFSAPMIQALLDGRKTQTRRLVSGDVPAEPAIDDVRPRNVVRHPAPYLDAYCGGRRTATNPRGMTDRWCWWTRDNRCGITFKVPYVPGDRLWVRESCCGEELDSGQDGVRFAADDAFLPIADTRDAADAWLALNHYRSGGKRSRRGKPVPSIHMPRWVSRLTLPVVSVRLQRLLDITEEDAEAEGVCHFAEQGHGAGSFEGLSGAERTARVCSIYGSCREAFRALWESLHGPASSNANPWVVAVGFDIHHANMDALEAVM